MNKDMMNSAFTYGILLIIIGILGRYFDWKQANTVFIMGVLFEVAALSIYIYNKYKK